MGCHAGEVDLFLRRGEGRQGGIRGGGEVKEKYSVFILIF